MIAKWLDYFSKKKSKEAFKATIRLRATLILSLGFLSLLLAWHLHLSEFQAGFLLGAAIAMFIISVRLFSLSYKDEAFHRYYVSYYDERNQQVKYMVSVVTVVAVIIYVIVLLLLYIFWQISLPYLGVLLSFIYGLILIPRIAEVIIRQAL